MAIDPVGGSTQVPKPQDDLKTAETKTSFSLGSKPPLTPKQKHNIIIKMIKKSLELNMLKQMQKQQKKMKQISKGNA